MKKHIILLFAAVCAFLFAGCCLTFRNATQYAADSFAAQLKQVEKDFKNKLAEKLDRQFANRPPSSVPDPAKPVTIPNFQWKYGGLNPQAPVNVWHGKLKSKSPTRVDMDYTGCPAWFGWGKGDENMYEVAVFWWDDALQRFVGGKFDWVNFPRTLRELHHTYRDPMYKEGHAWQWKGEYRNRAPDYIVIVNTTIRDWMIFD